MKYNFCTIFNYSYIPQALVLEQSCRQHLKQDFMLWILCMDYETHSFFKKNKIKNVTAIFWRNFANERYCQQYYKHKKNIHVCCWIAKAFFLEYLLKEKDLEKIVYCDTDMKMLANPCTVFDKDLESYDVCITPHYYDSFLRKKRYHLLYGKYNAGFIGVTKRAYRFLTWWQNKCCDRCEWNSERGPQNGGAMDQGYLDSIERLQLAKVKCLDKRYNIGPWNVQSVMRKPDGFYVEKQKVVFYHFHHLRVQDWGIRRKCAGEYTVQHVKKLYSQYAKDLKMLQKRYDMSNKSEILQKLNAVPVDMSIATAYSYGVLFKDPFLSNERLLFIIYAIASHCKKNGVHGIAKKLFAYITKTEVLIPDHLRGGAFFHLGDIMRHQGKKKEAKKLFNNCLIHIPDHQMARRLQKVV